jgi:phenylacetate-coenzyme A ligase PaaK-like adenylate-forming protein
MMNKDRLKHLPIFPPGRSSLAEKIFEVSNEWQFNELALEIFQFQFNNNPIYRTWCENLQRTPGSVTALDEIPFLPVEFFKNFPIKTWQGDPITTFSSSGTTGQITSQHLVADTYIYEQSLVNGFQLEYGAPSDWIIIGLLPAYLERPGSSLVYMTDILIRQSGQKESGFYLNNYEELVELLTRLKEDNRKVWLIGVSFALLDMAEKMPKAWENLVVVETGGMKGRRREMIRVDLHETIRTNWNITRLHSEYGMTELFSQAWMNDSGRFHTPPWMKVMIRETDDPFSYAENGKTGGINVVDLANLDSCTFISTSDLGKKFADETFDVLGRFDHSDVRGCNLMVG